MYVKEIWRYPVKSLRGERLARAEVLRSGLRGDRQVVVFSADRQRLMTARTFPGLLGLQGSVSESGETLINGLPWRSADALQLVQEATKSRVHLAEAGLALERFDVLPLLLATDGAVRAVEVDMRRLRPNIVVAGVNGHEETTWAGQNLTAGPVQIAVAQRRMRCVMTTYDPETLVQDLGVLRRIVARTGGKLALDCAVRKPGIITEGDPVALSI